ncbi:hypothetical protein O181_002653 [Austropuccinia psidii MF-1]|uniref:Endonuclease/exonuclease/phosphatase domain-containing protein n=1 Tax=Austropuccinia psidii MF-1 TaxID=1389203 RepID=A0A9Q3GCU3_9BASI|nr:hypothetical protein [Austropuccinia psidii MF-1]
MEWEHGSTALYDEREKLISNRGSVQRYLSCIASQLNVNATNRMVLGFRTHSRSNPGQSFLSLKPSFTVGHSLHHLINRAMDADELIAEKRRARAAKKSEKQKVNISGQPNQQQAGHSPQMYLARKLKSVGITVNQSEQNHNNLAGGKTLKIMTWNILAQCLVRRTLFPGSDFLKWKDRGSAITREILHYDPDVICLQEVDRLPDHGPVLNKAGFDYTHVIGGYEEDGKQHGLLIGWKRDLLNLSRKDVIRLDEQQFQSRHGLSRVTRNVALNCALAFNHHSGGLIIGTAHLFWHARFAYERVRQTGFLAKAICEFSMTNEDTAKWPVFIAGDLNEEPGGPSYRLLSGAEMSEREKLIVNESCLVHKSVDQLFDQASRQYVTFEGDEDRVFKDVRQAETVDGLFDLEELRSIYGPWSWSSLYGTWGAKMPDEENNRFKDRLDQRQEPASILSSDFDIKVGKYEPMWTNFTPLWRCTLDYIWLLNNGSNVHVVSLLPTHRTELLEPGLPRLGVEPSDHIALMAEIMIGPE